MRPALPIAIAALAAALLLSACGSSGSDTNGAPQPLKRSGTSGAPIGASVQGCASAGVLRGLKASGVGCETAVSVSTAWNSPRCRLAKGESRSACTVREYRCLSVRTAKGVAVNCARSGRSISFAYRP